MKISRESRKNYYFKSKRHCVEWIRSNFNEIVRLVNDRNGYFLCYVLYDCDHHIDGIDYYYSTFGDDNRFYTKKEVINYIVNLIYDYYDYNGSAIC